MVTLQVLLFALSLWLGLYLLTREPNERYLRWSGASVLVYTGILAANILLEGPYGRWLVAIGILASLFDLVALQRRIIQLGEAFLPDLLRSLDAAALFALLFAGPIALTLWLSTGYSVAMMALLLFNLSAAIVMQVFATPIQSVLDRIAFPSQPQLQESRAELRTVSDLLPKMDEGIDLAAMPEEEFVRLTRRALSLYGDLPKLAASPLTRLPVITARLTANNVTNHNGEQTLARAHELKRLLHIAIEQLKPVNQGDFGTSESWRHYNSLYFPYVAGLKPYNSRVTHDSLHPTHQQALHWLQREIPERTLHNWQKSAAILVARYLREAKG